MLNCRDTVRLISAHQDGPIGIKPLMSLNFHVMMCRVCRQYRATVAAIGHAARNLAPDGASETLSEEARARLQDVIESESRNSGQS